MTRERWKQVEAAFEQALELPLDQRAAFLENNCDGDEELLGEVQSLLDSHARAGSFIDQASLFVASDEAERDEAMVASGQLIGSYRIVRELGRGGMGTVYLAERADAQYQKRVAIKLIKRGMDTDAVLRRFRNERQILASFDHANIARLFDAGTTATGLPYFVMEYVEGASIDKYCDAHALSVPDRLRLFCEVCAAVAYAHRCGVIHRDIKSSNIVVTGEGAPKLVDFGIAKILQTAGAAETLVTTTDLQPMTPQYASPEQIRGESLTGATDIYSLGVVLYELLTGQLPYRFVSQSPHDVARAITEQEPTRPSTASAKSSGNPKSQVPNPKLLRGDLDNIVLKALRKEPELRYQSVEQLSEDIRRHLEGRPIIARPVSAPARAWRWSRRNPILAGAAGVCLLLALAVVWLLREQSIAPKVELSDKSIAILPFEYLGADQTDAYLADGIQEEIFTRLSKVAELKVISRTSTQRYKSKPDNLPEMARHLGVAHILEGSVQKAADQLRVNVQLINAQTDSHLWAEKFDRKLTDIFEVETEIASKIADTLQARLTGSVRQTIAARPTENSKAHELYLRGRFYWNKPLAQGFEKSREYYQQAIELDPTYALAYAGLADYYGFAFANGLLPPEEKWAKAEEDNAKKALELDPTLGEAYNPLAAVKLYYYRDWPAAERDFRRGLELSPNFAEMRAHYAFCLVLFGRNEEALAEMQRALDLDPLSTRFGFVSARLFFIIRQYDAAIDQFRKALELDPNFPNAHESLGYAYEKKQMQAEAIAEWNKALTLSGESEQAALLQHTYTVSGFEPAVRALAQKKLEKLNAKAGRGEYVPPLDYAIAYVRMGDKEQAFAWLAKAASERSRLALEIKVDPMLDPLRGDPRFEKLANEVLAAEGPAPEKSIAVLPFEYLGADKADAYFADGIQEEILTRLSKVADLKVISRTSTQRYKSNAENLPEIARQLGVAHVLEGSVQKAADQLRVNVQLINARTDSHLWADNYDRKLTDIFAVESEIATKIAQTLQAKLTGLEQETIAARQTQDTEAHELYLKGRFFFDKRTPHDLQKAIEFFRQALAKDPNYAVAYAGIADVYAILHGYAGGSVKEAIANARAAAEKALAIDNNLAEAHSALALSLAADFDLQAARREFERAIELNPNYADAHYALGFSVLGPLGQFDAAIGEMKRAVDLDPLSVTMNGNLAYCYIFARRYPEAIAASDKAIELDARNPKGQDVRAMGLELSGHVAEAIAQYQRSFEASGGDYHSLWFLSRLYGLRGERAKASQTFEKAKQIQQKQGVEFAYGYAVMNIGLGNYDEAIKWLERGYESKEAVVPICYMIADPMLDPLRGNPRFEKLAKRIASELSATPGPEKSVAVLPFEYLSADKSEAYLADGIQEEILNRLSKIADLKVISRTSTEGYKDPARDVREIARQLGVAHVVEGTVQKVADQVRVNVQLIKAQTDAQLWADKFDRKLTDIFALETEVATKIADSLQAKLTGAEQRAISSRPTQNSEAHQAYLKGLYYWNKFLSPDFAKSREYFQRAIDLDPSYAAAYARLGLYYGFAAGNGLIPPDEGWPKAEAAVNKALALDETLAEVYNPLAAIKLYRYRDWPAAERAFRRGIELNSNLAELHQHYALCLILFGRNEDASGEIQRGAELNPVSFPFNLNWARILFLTRQYDRAIEQFRTALDLDPNYALPHQWLGDTYEKKQMHKEAITEWSKALSLIGAREDASLLEQTYVSAGFDAALRLLAQKQLERLKEKTARGEYVPAVEYVTACVRLADKEQAFAWLAKAVEERNWFALHIKTNPMFDPLRGDPRFETLVQKIFVKKE